MAIFGRKRDTSLLSGGYEPLPHEQTFPQGRTDFGNMQPGLVQAEAPQPEKKRSVLPYILAAAEDTLARQMGYEPQGVARLNAQADEQRALLQRAQIMAQQLRNQSILQQQGAALTGQNQRRLHDYKVNNPTPGSFGWYQQADPTERALYDEYNPHVVATGAGPVAVRRGPDQPNAAHIEHLRQNPSLAAEFDAKFGAGAAARALGQ